MVGVISEENSSFKVLVSNLGLHIYFSAHQPLCYLDD